jgi:hypothetical protein
MVNPEADFADYLVELAKQDVIRHPRSPIAVTKATKEAIDMSGIFLMSPDQIDEALRQMEAAA